MSYFIFKGIHSDDLVRVESLPPPIKAPKRYNIKEIDGSSITHIDILGYKAYSKTIKLWFKDLESSGELSRVMDWLDGSGQLILSNEPDIYYDAFILNQINYEKAIRFRTASVEFLVQPYKHALGEEETTSRIVINQGNTNCLPLMTIIGNGLVDIFINGVKACSITINGYVTIDSEDEEAYRGSSSYQQNRFMVGDFPELLPGENVISFAGSVTEVKTLVRSRWI